MALTRRLFRVFGVRAGEGAPVGWLIANSLFIGVFCAFFLTAANALFLDRFEITMLPVAYIVAAAVGYLAVMGFSRLEKALPVGRLLVTNLVVLTVIAAVFWWLTRSSGNEWVIFAMFVWVGPAFSLIFLGYWGLAVRLFDLRQGKRLFGLVGAGEEVSTVIGLFSIPLLMRYLHGPVPLLLFAVAGLIGCLVVVTIMTRVFAHRLQDEPETTAGGTRRRRAGLGELVKQRYFLLMAALIILLSLAHYMVDFSFLSQIRVKFEGSSEIAQFLGVFFGVTKVLELLMKVFVSGRLVSNFGLKVGLMVLPSLLAMCAGLAIVIGTLGLAVTHFFVLVALAKLVWVVARTSTFLPSFRVLYQPVASSHRLAYQTHVDGTAKQLAIGVVGLGLLAFSSSPSFNALNLFYVLVPILAVWILVIVRLHRDYRTLLMGNLEAEKDSSTRDGQVDRLMDSLILLQPERLEESVALLARVDATAVVPLFERMITDGDEPSRIAALDYIRRLKAMAGLGVVERCAAADPSPLVRAAAERTLRTLQELTQLAEDPDRVAQMADSDRAADRDMAVSAIGFARDYRRHVSLTELLWDKDRDVRRAALVAAGRTGDPAYWHRITSQLMTPQFANAATFGLITIGEPVLAELEKTFSKAENLADVQARILRIYERIDHPRARQLLLNKLAYPNRTIRRKALLSLGNVGYQVSAGQRSVVVNEIEDVVRTMAWNMAAVLDIGGETALGELRQALETEIAEGRQSLFMLLAILYDPQSVDLVRRSLESQRPEAIVYALEILDLLIAEDLKPMVFPLLEDLSYGQILRRLDILVPRQRLGLSERLSAIVNRDYDRVELWTRSLAVSALAKVTATFRPELKASLFHPDPLVREAAAEAAVALDREAYGAQLDKLPAEIRDSLSYAVAMDSGCDPCRSSVGRTAVLRQVTALQPLPTHAVALLAQASEERVLRRSQRLPSAKDMKDALYVLVEGDLVAVGSHLPAVNGATIGQLDIVRFGRDREFVEATEDSRLIRLDLNQLYELASEYVELVPSLVQEDSHDHADDEAVLAAPVGEATLMEARDQGMSV